MAQSTGQVGGSGGNAFYAQIGGSSSVGSGGSAGSAGDGAATGTSGGAGRSGGGGSLGGGGGEADSGGGGGGASGQAVGGGGAGAGGAGLSSTLVGDITISDDVEGGRGGWGGNGAFISAAPSAGGGGGGGGGGGSGLYIKNSASNVSVTINSGVSVVGGTGGNGGTTKGSAFNSLDIAQGGAGGHGIRAETDAGATITNYGSIRGGQAGGSDSNDRRGVAGAGIFGRNLSIINSGSISGGTGANAITITGGTNSIQALTGSRIGLIELRSGSVTTFSGSAFNDSVTVNGGATMSIAGSTSAGDASGLYDIQNYGTVSIGAGRTLSTQTVNNRGTVEIGAGSTWKTSFSNIHNYGTVNVATGGIIYSEGGYNNYGGSVLNFNGTGSIGTAADWGMLYNPGQINVKNGDVIATGALADDAIVSNEQGGAISLTGGNFTGVATLNNKDTATITVASGYNLGVGTLNFSGGSATGAGTITASTALNFSAGGTVETKLAGAAALTKTGSGTLILSANNTYSGGTTISAGTLQIGNGGTSGSIVGDITNNGTLA